MALGVARKSREDEQLPTAGWEFWTSIELVSSRCVTLKLTKPEGGWANKRRRPRRLAGRQGQLSNCRTHQQRLDLTRRRRGNLKFTGA